MDLRKSVVGGQAKPASRVSKKCARRCVDLHQRPARCLGSVIGYLVWAEAIMLASAPIVLTPEYTQRGEVADTANQAPDAVAARRPRGRNRLADVIFKALCLLISVRPNRPNQAQPR